MKTLEDYKRNEIYIYLSQFKKIYIYGAGKEASKRHAYLKSMNVNIDGFVVTNSDNNKDNLEGKPVVEISAIDDGRECLFVIGVSDLYEHEIIECLSKRGYNNILKISKGIDIWKINRNFPKLEITAKIGCQIQCKYCPQELFYKKYFENNKSRQAEMTFEDYKICLSHMPKETIVCFAGFVEPFFHPQGVQMIEYAYDMGYEVELFTTFMGLKKKDFDKIKGIPFRQVVLHTPDKMKYANIVIDDEYTKIIDEALDIVKSDGRPFIDSANCQSEPSEEFLKLARGRVLVESSLVDRAGNLEDEGLRSSGLKKGKIICNRTNAMNHWVLLPDGTVTLCCMDFGLTQQLGNLKWSTYSDIVKGKPYMDILNEMSEFHDERFLCRNCTSSSIVQK